MDRGLFCEPEEVLRQEMKRKEKEDRERESRRRSIVGSTHVARRHSMSIGGTGILGAVKVGIEGSDEKGVTGADVKNRSNSINNSTGGSTQRKLSMIYDITGSSGVGVSPQKDMFRDDNAHTNHHGAVNTDHIDFLSAEIEFQRALALLAKNHPLDHPIVMKARAKLLDIYKIQMAERESYVKEMTEEFPAHIARLSSLVASADQDRKREVEHSQAHKRTSQVLRMRHQASVLATNTREHIQENKALMSKFNVEEKLKEVCELSHSMTLGETEEYFAFKGIGNLYKVGEVFEEDDEREQEERGTRKYKETVRSKGYRESVINTKSVKFPVDWYTSNRMDVNHGIEVREEGFETATDSMKRIARGEFGLAAKTTVARISRGGGDVTDGHLFRATLGALKSHPHMNDFLADVYLKVQKQSIIGEPFEMEYNYVHRRDRERPHSPKDWIGIFRIGDISIDFDPNMDDREVAKCPLICWCHVPDNRNYCSFTVSPSMVTCTGNYRALYFVSGSEAPLGGSNNFKPNFVSASIEILRATRPQDEKFIEISPEKREDLPEVSVKCGTDVRIGFKIDHGKNFIHHAEDCIALLMDDGKEPLLSNAVDIIRLPRDANEGEIEVENICPLPGLYRLYYFCKIYDNRVCGQSLDILASLDFGHHDATRLLNSRKNREYKIYFSTRWDMEMEREAWASLVVPSLRKYCEDRHVDFSFVDVSAEKADRESLMDGRALSKILWGIKYCRPCFLCCSGEMAGEKIDTRFLKSPFGMELVEDFPWLADLARRKRECGFMTTITEVELNEALFVPELEHSCIYNDTSDDIDVKNDAFFFSRHPSLHSQSFTAEDKLIEGINSISSIKKKKLEMREFNEKILAIKGLKSINKYASSEEFVNLVLPAIEGSIERSFPTQTLPSSLDIISAESQLACDAIRAGYVRHLDKPVYRCQSEANDVSKVYKPVNEKFGSVHIGARTRAILEGRDRPLTFYELLEGHLDALNQSYMLIVDGPQSGLSVKLFNFLKGYSDRNGGATELPQWGKCITRGVIVRNFKVVKVDFGAVKHTLLVKSKANIVSDVQRICLTLYLDLRRPNQRWKIDTLCKYLMREMRRTFDLKEEVPTTLGMTEIRKEFHDMLEAVSVKGDLIFILDGVDVFDSYGDDDPLSWLPEKLPSCCRLIMTCRPSSRYAAGAAEPNNKRECIIMKRKSGLIDGGKESCIKGMCSHLGFAIDERSLRDVWSSDKCCTIGYLKFVVTELYFRGLFKDAGRHNIEMRWGLYKLKDLDDDGCGGDEKMKEIIAVCSELLKCDTIKQLYTVRLKRLLATVPFFDSCIALIRLSRKGLGEDEIRRLLTKEKFMKKEARRAKYYAQKGVQECGDVEKKDSKDKREEAKDESKEKKGETKTSTTTATTTPQVETPISFTNDHWIALNDKLAEICINCLGKFTPHNSLTVRVIDDVLAEVLGEMREWEKDAKDGRAGEGGEEKGFGVAVVEKEKGKDKETFKWKIFYSTMLIDLFRESACSIRKAEELPFALRQHCKYIDTSEKKKITKYKEYLLKTLLNIEMFFRLHDDIYIDSLLEYLNFCGASKFKIIQVLLQNFYAMFGISPKKMDKIGEYNFHLLDKSDLGEGVTKHEFVNVGTMYLLEIGKFLHKCLFFHKEAQQICQSCLLMLFNERAFVGKKKDSFGARPANISLSIAFIILSGKCYFTRAMDYKRSLSDRGRGGKNAKHAAIIGEGALVSLQKLTALRGGGGGSASSPGDIGIGGGGVLTKGSFGAIKKKEVAENKVDWQELRECFKLCHNLTKKLERIGISEEDCVDLEAFDEAYDSFLEMYDTFVTK